MCTYTRGARDAMQHCAGVYVLKEKPAGKKFSLAGTPERKDNTHTASLHAVVLTIESCMQGTGGN